MPPSPIAVSPARPLRIALVSPKGPLYRHRGGIWKKSLRYQPLTLTTLAALVPPELPHTLALYDEGIMDVPERLDVDVVGITVITGTAPRAYELAARWRAQGVTVVLGGPHVTLVPDDAQPHADAIVTGYAEDTWPELLHDLVAGRLRPRYVQAPGLSLAGRPFARRELLPSEHFLTSNVFEATRGCVHPCEFCVVPTAWGRRPYLRPVHEVVDEIRRHGARKAIFPNGRVAGDPAKPVTIRLDARFGPFTSGTVYSATTTALVRGNSSSFTPATFVFPTAIPGANGNTPVTFRFTIVGGDPDVSDKLTFNTGICAPGQRCNQSLPRGCDATQVANTNLSTANAAVVRRGVAITVRSGT